MKFKFRRVWLKRLLLILSPFLLVAILLISTFIWLFIPFVSDPNFAEPETDIEAYEQDLTYLAEYADYEKAFEDSSKRVAFINYLTEVRQNLASMTPARFELAVARAVAFADNGHTNVSPIARSSRVNHLPIRTGSFEDGEFVLQATNEHADLLGAEIIEIEGSTIESVTTAFIPYFGGIERRSKFFTHLFITSPELLYAQGISASPSEVVVNFRLLDSTLVKRRLVAIEPQASKREPFGRELMDYRVPKGDEDSWTYLMKDHKPPLFLAEPDKPYLYSYLEERNGAYIKINFNYDVGGYSLTDWLDNVEADLQKRKCEFAIVDLRFNGGGTDATSSFSKALPKLVQNDGPIYILTSRETFSAAIAAVAEFKKMGGSRVIIVGSQVGDRLRFIANGGSVFTLPNSKISLNIWSTYEDYEMGCWDWRDCFWLSPFFRKSGVGTIDPDVYVPVFFSDYEARKDPVFEACITNFNNQKQP
jgi:hypothetical protein